MHDLAFELFILDTRGYARIVYYQLKVITLLASETL